MKKYAAFIIGSLTCIGTSAQEADRQLAQPETVGLDSLSIAQAPTLDFKPTLFSIGAPWRPYGFSYWNIHKGFNASIDMGVMAGFGKYNPFKGVSFFQNLAGLYAAPMGKRWTLAAGAELERYRIFNEYVNNLTVNGMASYALNDRMSLTGFASHTFGRGMGPFYYPTMPFAMDNRTTVGLDFGMDVTPSFSFHVSVSNTSGDWATPPNYMNERKR